MYTMYDARKTRREEDTGRSVYVEYKSWEVARVRKCQAEVTGPAERGEEKRGWLQGVNKKGAYILQIK